MARQRSLNDRAAAEARGRRAERLAALWLMAKGYRILRWRFRCEAGEIDLIAQRGNTIAMVEVKARTTHEAARLSITPHSEQRIGKAAAIWLAQHRPHFGGTVRYDAVTLAKWWPKHWPDAFRPHDGKYIVNPDDLF